MKPLQSLIFAMLTIGTTALSQGIKSEIKLPVMNITSKGTVSQTVDTVFGQMFPKETQSTWFKINKTYIADFITHDISRQKLFTRTGSLKYEITYMRDDMVPGDIVSLISMAYDSYLITSGARVVRAGQELWLINLEGPCGYVIVRAEEGDLTEVVRVFKSAKNDQATN